MKALGVRLDAITVLALGALVALGLAAPERARPATADWFAEYRNLREIEDHLALLATRHPDLATPRVLGASIEGRPISALEISRGGKLGIVIDGGQHAREWISVMVAV